MMTILNLISTKLISTKLISTKLISTKLVQQKAKLMTLVCFVSLSAIGAEAPPSPVEVARVKVADSAPSADIMGTVFSRNQVQLTAGVSGRLEWVVEPGSYVKKGDLVAQIELLPLKLRQAEQVAQLKRARINLEYLERELQRQKELRQKHSSSQYQLDQTQSQFELSQSDLEIADLKLKQINQELEKATILSPFDGVITERKLRAGFDVNRSDILVELLDTENLEVRLAVPLKYLAYTNLDSKLVLSSKNESGDELKIDAIVNTIIPAADARSQTFEMRIAIPKSGQEYWASGQLVKVTLPIESKRVALTVHRDALILRRDGTYVIKIDEENKAHRLKVKVGKGSGDWVTVEGDLKQGDNVAIRGAERLAEGQSVVIQATGA